jgi:CRISPR system Cascade subunit CasE
MYLTRVVFDGFDRRSQRLFSSPERVHALVCAATDAERGNARTLWRLDSRLNRNLTMFIVSAERPDVDILGGEKGGKLDLNGFRSVDYTPFLDRIVDGQEYHFRLTANPVRSLARWESDGTPRRGQRVEHRTASAQLDWLLRRMPRLGLAPVATAAGDADVAIVGRERLRFRKQGHEVTIATATYEGTVRVTEPALLRKALGTGVGPGKAYGCGLLTLARA